MKIRNIITTGLAAVLICSCSTTRVLQDGEFRLARNKISITNDKSFNTNQIEPYLKQKPNSYFIFGWNPFLNVYNWADGKGKGWDKFVKKIGVAPVVYDPEMVESSVENITRHLEYLGYFDSAVDTRIEHIRTGGGLCRSILQRYIIFGRTERRPAFREPSGVRKREDFLLYEKQGFLYIQQELFLFRSRYFVLSRFCRPGNESEHVHEK